MPHPCTPEKVWGSHIRMINEYLPGLMLGLTLKSNSGGGSKSSAVAVSMRYAVLNGGKRIRASMVLESARMFSVPLEMALPVAAAVECLHSYSLIHDDLPCMDDDSTRRGLPTIHSIFGDAIAVLAGDALHSLAFQIISDMRGLDPRKQLKLISSFANACGIHGMIGGQEKDISIPTKHLCVDDIDYIKDLYSKTTALIKFSVISGAIMGGACEMTISFLEDFAEAAGFVYQIHDDVLNATGNEEQVGKTLRKKEVGNFVSVYGLDYSVNKAKDLLEKANSSLAEVNADCSVIKFISSTFATRNY